MLYTSPATATRRRKRQARQLRERAATGWHLGAAEPVDELNTAFDDSRPNVRKDRLDVVFDSTRDGGPQKIHTAARASIFDPRLPPERLGGNVNMEGAAEPRASLSRDGTRLYFGSNRSLGRRTTLLAAGAHPSRHELTGPVVPVVEGGLGHGAVAEAPPRRRRPHGFAHRARPSNGRLPAGAIPVPGFIGVTSRGGYNGPVARGPADGQPF